MTYEARLKSHYAQAHKRLITPDCSPKKVLKIIPKIEPPPPPPAPKIEVIPELPTAKLDPPKPRYSLARLATWLCDLELVGVLDLRSKQRPRHITLPRMIFYHLAFKHSGGRFSSVEIGRYINKDHTSVLSGVARIAERRKTDPQLHFRLCQYENALIHQYLFIGESEQKCLCSLCPYR